MNEKELLEKISNPIEVADLNLERLPKFYRVDELRGRRIAIYGHGSGFITLKCFVLSKFKIEPEFVIDQKFTSNQDNKFVSLNNINCDEDFFANGLVVISNGAHSAHVEISAQLISMGFKNIINAAQLLEYHLSHADPTFTIENALNFFKKNTQKMIEAYSLLEDEVSKSVFVNVLQFYSGTAINKIISRPISEQYFPSDVPLKKGFNFFINCGSFDGDTIKQFCKFHKKIDTLICFEPDKDNFALLARYLAKNSNKIANEVYSYPCGLSSQNEILRFNAGDRVNSSVDAFGSDAIQCVSMDRVISPKHITYINMDIEGFEPRAIEGAKDLISLHKPDLGICVYHSPEHLWEIPLLIKKLNPAYKFYLRNYTGYPAETVLYSC